MLNLPIEPLLPKIQESLQSHPRLVLQAEPGAGKSTRVPADLLSASWLEGRKILLLEPRRIAARNLASFVARQLGETLGQTVGLQVRFERRISSATRLEVLTEGLLTRRLQTDPELADVGLIIFDEFHERHLQTDLGLALALEVQQELRPDLRLLLMSATLDTARLGAWLDAPVLKVSGRSHPVTIEYRLVKRGDAAAVASRIKEVLSGEQGDALVFLPGVREIRQTAGLLEAGLDPGGFEIRCLHGSLSLDEQGQALSAAGDGRRRVVLATNIAESSLTVPGIRIVVDSGLARAPVFHPGSGLTHLETRRISRASAKQRAGRAGRLEAGAVLRLWSKEERLQAAWPAEITSADLLPMTLELALWGARAEQMRWLDPPPPGALEQARLCLQSMAVLDAGGKPTAVASRLGRWGTHPRLALLLERAGDDLPLAADTAALIESYRPLPPEPRSDELLHRLEQLWQSRRTGHRDPFRKHSIEPLVRRWCGGKACTVSSASGEKLGKLLAPAWPDRIARLREGQDHRYLLANGKGVILDQHSELAGSAFLVAIEMSFDQRESRIKLAVPLREADLLAEFSSRIRPQTTVAFDHESQSVVARSEQRLGELVLTRKLLAKVPPEAAREILVEEIKGLGLGCLPWKADSERLRQRLAFAGHCQPDGQWAAVDDRSLLDALDHWLGDQLTGLTRLAQLRKLDLCAALRQRLDWQQQQSLDGLAPESVAVPSGRRRPVDYSNPEAPVLAVKLQEMFGTTTTPQVGLGRIGLTLHLLSPAGRPLQITRDLAHFWNNAYQQVRKENRGRYPKHPWPDDPLAAQATASTKARQ